MKADSIKWREFLSYDPDTGEFTWIKKVRKRTLVGERAGGRNTLGYILIQVGGVQMYAHRLAWWFVHGEWPSKNIDHIDGNKDNNRIGNLRLCGQKDNNGNRGAVARPRPTKFKGVCWHKRGKKWAARVAGKHLGMFDTDVSAAIAYDRAALEYYGEFARLNFPQAKAVQ